jgi:hypothetical protein
MDDGAGWNLIFVWEARIHIFGWEHVRDVDEGPVQNRHSGRSDQRPLDPYTRLVGEISKPKKKGNDKWLKGVKWI